MRILDSLKRALGAAADLMMPRVCLCCGGVLEPEERHLCSACEKDLPLTRYWKMRDNPLSEKYNAMIQRRMGDDVRYRPFGYASALFFYKGGYRNITKGLKYKRNFAAGRHFASVLGRTLAESVLFENVDLVIPVPLHRTRRWSRGYNQAEIIAIEVARELGVPCRTDLLRRRRRTRSQTRLDSGQRERNVTGAFSPARKSPVRSHLSKGNNRPEPESPFHILLIDDVFTTGATVAACEEALRKTFGCKTRISVATIACVNS